MYSVFYDHEYKMTTGIGNPHADLKSCQGLFVLLALFLIET